jgi:hypothetical protein
MDKLIFTAVSGAERLLRAQQVHANNLANMDTSGFRASMEVATNQKLGGFGYDDRHMSRMQADMVSTRAGTVRETGRPLDVAIGGKGYLAVQYGGRSLYPLRRNRHRRQRRAVGARPSAAGRRRPDRAAAAHRGGNRHRRHDFGADRRRDQMQVSTS